VPSNHLEAQQNAEGPVRQLLALLPMTALWALLAQGILSVTRLLTSMTVGGKFSPVAALGTDRNEQLGYYWIGFSTLMLVVALFEAFITTPLTVFNQQQLEKEKPRFSAQTLFAGLLLIGLIVGVSGSLIFVQFQTSYLNPGLSLALIATAILAPFQLLREFSRRWLLANLRAKESTYLEIAFQPLLQQIPENYRYGRWVAGENVCAVLTMYFCNWFLAYQLGEEATGVFGSCFQVVLLANPFLLGIASILAPRAAAAFNEQAYPGMLKVLIKFGIVMFTVMMLFSLLLWFAGDQITAIMFPTTDFFFEEYLHSQNRITAVLGLALPAMGLSYLASCGLMAAHRPRDNFYSAIIGAIVLIALNFCFPETTLMTAAISFILSYCAATTCRLFFLANAFLKSSQPNQDRQRQS